jgi:hypothetical protein
MSKRNEHPEGLGEGNKASRMEETEKDEEDTVFAAKLQAWTDQQSIVRDMLRPLPALSGIISLPVVVEKSLLAHKEDMMKKGYKYYEKSFDRSLFEKFMREGFEPAIDAGENIASVVFKKLRGCLEQVNIGSKPVKNSISILVMMDTKYIKPIADMIYLLLSTYSTVEDLDLVWELLERVWCFGHPVFRYQTKQDLDLVCERISKRKIEVDNALRIHGSSDPGPTHGSSLLRS